MEGKPSFAERRNCRKAEQNERAIRVLALPRKLELGLRHIGCNKL